MTHGPRAGGGGTRPGREAGLQPERTRLAWRRTTLAGTVTAVLVCRAALRHAPGPVAVLGCVLCLISWLALVAVAHRRIHALTVAPGRPMTPRLAAVAVLCTVLLAGCAVCVSV
jgi:uncharacterized membrane protein YidH (DUF202 family)